MISGRRALKSRAVTTSPWKSAWKALVKPQPGHANPVNLYNGQAGKNPAVVGSKYQTAAEPRAKTPKPAAAAIRSAVPLIRGNGAITSDTPLLYYLLLLRGRRNKIVNDRSGGQDRFARKFPTKLGGHLHKQPVSGDFAVNVYIQIAEKLFDLICPYGEFWAVGVHRDG